MRYACVFYGDETHMESLTKKERDALVAKANAWVEELKRSGHYVLSAGLQSSRTATTLRKRDGILATTDGPFAETKEQLGGITVLEARDLNEAIHLASKAPCIHMGCIEVRPLFGIEEEPSNSLDQKEAIAIATTTQT